MHEAKYVVMSGLIEDSSSVVSSTMLANPSSFVMDATEDTHELWLSFMYVFLSLGQA